MSSGARSRLPTAPMRYTLAQGFPVPLPPNLRAHSPGGSRAQHESHRRVSRYGRAGHRRGTRVDYELIPWQQLRAADCEKPDAVRLTLCCSVFPWTPPPYKKDRCLTVWKNTTSSSRHPDDRMLTSMI